MKKRNIYRDYNLLLVISSFIFLQYFFTHLPPAYQWSFKTLVLTPFAVISGIVIYDLLVRARFSNIEKGKEEYASWVLKQMKPKLDSALDDMCSKFDKERYEKYLSPFYQKLKAVSEMMEKNILKD